MRLMDCPADYAADLDSMIRLLREKKNLAAKLSAGTYGIGFYKLEANGEDFAVNGKAYSEADFRKFLASLNDYILTEYVEMHPQLKKLNPYSVNTFRVMVINKTGNDPTIPFSFFRIASP